MAMRISKKQLSTQNYQPYSYTSKAISQPYVHKDHVHTRPLQINISPICISDIHNISLEDKMCKLGKVGLDWIDRSRLTGLIDARCMLLEGQCLEVETVLVLILTTMDKVWIGGAARRKPASNNRVRRNYGGSETITPARRGFGEGTSLEVRFRQKKPQVEVRGMIEAQRFGEDRRA
ncbi:hypothetical protein YC2023_016191 [Brassica napus]